MSRSKSPKVWTTPDSPDGRYAVEVWCPDEKGRFGWAQDLGISGDGTCMTKEGALFWASKLSPLKTRVRALGEDGYFLPLVLNPSAFAGASL